MDTQRKRFLDWVIYQIYPRSFYDFNGDGVGDLDGVTAKLDYLEKLGVNAIWLCPCYKSPNADNGYDVADYRNIAEEYGTLDAWKRLRDETKKRNMKLIMDLVLNHTSSEHIWFQNAKKSRDNPYHAYYIWAEKPLNEWKSVFGGSAWAYNEQTKEYYLHSFSVDQPDLNWENAKVRKECQDIVDFWIDMGVDGFRCDVLDFIAKDFSQDKQYGGARLHGYIRELFGREKTKNVFTVGECQSNEKDIADICGANRQELTAVFQFDHIRLARKNKYRPTAFSFDRLRKILVKWQNFTQENDLLYTLFTDNHDNPYFLSRTEYGEKYRYELATDLAACFFLLRGIPFLYQTQEYGASNPRYENISDFNEVESLRYYNARKNKTPRDALIRALNDGSRDNTRRPFAWSANEAEGYGFSKGKPWIGYHSRANEINFEQDEKSEKSVFAFYQKLFSLRKTYAALRYGEFTDLTRKKRDCFLYKRSFGKEEIIVICNFIDEKRILPNFVTEKEYRLLLFNYPRTGFEPLFHAFETAVYVKI